MQKRRLALALDESLIKQVDKRGDAMMHSRPEQITHDLESLYVQEYCALGELRNKFTLEELVLIWNYFQGIRIYPGSDFKGTLLNGLLDPLFAAEVFEGINEYIALAERKKALRAAAKAHVKSYQQLRESVTKKIRTISSFQVYALYTYIKLLNSKYGDNPIDPREAFKIFFAEDMPHSLATGN